MFKRFISVAATTSFLLASMPAGYAQSADVYNPHSNFGQRSEVSASLYLRVPFNGGLKRVANQEARFGLALRATLPQSFSTAANTYGYSFQGSQNQQVKVLDLSIGPSFFKNGGFKSFKLNGHSLAEFNALYADGEGGDKKSNAWLYVLGGAVLLGGVLAIVAVAHCDKRVPLGTRTC